MTPKKELCVGQVYLHLYSMCEWYIEELLPSTVVLNSSMDDGWWRLDIEEFERMIKAHQFALRP